MWVTLIIQFSVSSLHSRTALQLSTLLASAFLAQHFFYHNMYLHMQLIIPSLSEKIFLIRKLLRLPIFSGTGTCI
ncbi:hypothetical protein PAHAL_5G538300 [Panicum hallii]|uniref:Uncharacterized protein n=1 Tax=Panicum hallii TaxID=206008 RepID=A0A2T8IPH2_9POAL|nr:hypothetical protein PAHAL_5G538300 [Panicum hallii]